MKLTARRIIIFEKIKAYLFNVKWNFSSNKILLYRFYYCFEWSISDGSSIIEWERFFLFNSKCKLSVDIS